MRLPVRLVLPAAGLAALACFGIPAGAEPYCTGTEEDAKVCVDPDALPGARPGEGEPASRCVYVPIGDDCETVTLPVAEPEIDPGSPREAVTCTGPCAAPVADAVEAAFDRAEKLREDAVDEHRACYTGATVRRAVSYVRCMVKPTGYIRSVQE